MNQHEKWIDELRVFACICVVIFHVVGNLYKDSIKVPLLLNIGKQMLALFHVPIFFIISGYLFGKRWNNYDKHITSIISYKKNYFNLILNKTINLGVPYLVFCILYISLSSLLFPNHALYGFDFIFTLWKTPIAQYWYLRTLLQLFFLVPILYFIVKSPWLLFGCSVLLRVLYLTHASFNNNLCKNSIYFCMGILFSHIIAVHKIKFHKNFPIIIRLSLMITVLLYVANKLIGSYEKTAQMTDTVFSILFVIEIVLYAYCNCSVTVLSRYMAGMSKYTLHIYLLHTWVIGAVRVFLCHLGIYNTLVHCLVGVFISFVFSLIGACIIKAIPILNIFCEPISTYKKMKTACNYQNIKKN